MMMKRNGRPRLLALVFLCLGAHCAAATVGAAEAPSSPPSGQRADGVFCLGRVEPHHGILHIGAPSMVNAVNGALLSKLLVEAGDRVTAGQLLAETDTAVVERGNVALAEAELELAEHRAKEAEGNQQDVCSRSDVAGRTSRRRSNLRDTGVISEEEADVAAGDAKALAGACAAARVATDAAQAAVAMSRARLERNQAELERCMVRAPVDGLVLRIVRRPGEMLGFDGVLEMGDVRRMYAIAEVYETDIRRVRTGQKATVTSPALAAPLSGVVERIRLQVRKQDATGTDPAARKDARIVEVEVLLDDPEPVVGLSNLQVEVLLHP